MDREPTSAARGLARLLPGLAALLPLLPFPLVPLLLGGCGGEGPAEDAPAAAAAALAGLARALDGAPGELVRLGLAQDDRAPSDFARWLGHRRELDARLAHDFALARLAVCRAANDDPWSAPAAIEARARELEEARGLRARLERALALADLATGPLPPSEPGAGTLAGLEAACARAHAEVAALRAPLADPGVAAGLDFASAWLLATGARYVPASREATPWELGWRLTHADPFAPGAARTAGGLAVPPSVPSMTSAYHLLRALGGAPHESLGITDEDARSPGVHARYEGAELGLEHLAPALGALADHLEPAALDRLARELAALPVSRDARVPGVEGDVLLHEDTPFGGLVVGGPGPNRYGEDAPAVILDVGGDDEYAPRAAPSARGLSLVLDLGGDDLYLARGVGGPGGAVAGVALLVDRAGDDRYLQGVRPTLGRGDLVPRAGGPEGPWWLDPGPVLGADLDADGGCAFGAALLGAGVLVDEAGDDLYLGDKLVFGAALGRGLGLLLDGGGADRALAANVALGSGVNGGAGILVADGADDDVYQCWGLYRFLDLPPGGRAPGFTSFGLGSGSAWRVETRTRGFERTPAGPGGLGLLVDAGGDDLYAGGSCQQGTGYGGGVGALLDRGGNDRYSALRGDPSGAPPAPIAGAHGLGDAAHLGTGLLLDAAGDDRYVVGEQGGGYGWDAGAGFLLDLGGADVYAGRGLDGAPLPAGAASAGAQGLGVLLDLAGADVFDPTCARLGDTSNYRVDYRVPGGNFAFLVLCGAARRALPGGDPGPGRARRVPAVGEDGAPVPFGLGLVVHE